MTSETERILSIEEMVENDLKESIDESVEDGLAYNTEWMEASFNGITTKLTYFNKSVHISGVFILAFGNEKGEKLFRWFRKFSLPWYVVAPKNQSDIKNIFEEIMIMFETQDIFTDMLEFKKITNDFLNRFVFPLPYYLQQIVCAKTMKDIQFLADDFALKAANQYILYECEPEYVDFTLQRFEMVFRKIISNQFAPKSKPDIAEYPTFYDFGEE